MDWFCEAILGSLRNGLPKDFSALLQETGFAKSTLADHLDHLVRDGLVLRKQKITGGRGRPSFTYRLSRGLPLETVTITFQKLKRLCRNEKGGYCKILKEKSSAQKCPQILRKE